MRLEIQSGYPFDNDYEEFFAVMSIIELYKEECDNDKDFDIIKTFFNSRFKSFDCGRELKVQLFDFSKIIVIIDKDLNHGLKMAEQLETIINDCNKFNIATFDGYVNDSFKKHIDSINKPPVLSLTYRDLSYHLLSAFKDDYFFRLRENPLTRYNKPVIIILTIDEYLNTIMDFEINDFETIMMDNYSDNLDEICTATINYLNKEGWIFNDSERKSVISYYKKEKERCIFKGFISAKRLINHIRNSFEKTDSNTRFDTSLIPDNPYPWSGKMDQWMGSDGIIMGEKVSYGSRKCDDIVNALEERADKGMDDEDADNAAIVRKKLRDALLRDTPVIIVNKSLEQEDDNVEYIKISDGKLA